MKSLFSHPLKFILLALFCASSMNLNSQLVVGAGGSTNDIAEAFVGSSIACSNVSSTYEADGYNLISGGITPIGVVCKALLASLDVTAAIKSNNYKSSLSGVNGAKDSDLYTIFPQSTIEEYVMSNSILLDAAGPCDAIRWEEGATWNSNLTIDDTPSGNDGFPNLAPANGIIRCGSSAETQSQIAPVGTYSSAILDIDIESFTCVEPSTGNIATPINPSEGQPIIWMNFDVRPDAGTFQVQINDNSGDEIAWALYYSNSPSAGVTLNAVTGEYLSGDCDDLSLTACGVESSNTWNTLPVPNFSSVTNYYIAIWDQDADGDLQVNNFKARFGCGDSDVIVCNVDFEGVSAECNGDGTYTVAVDIVGLNGQYQASDGNALNSPSDPVCLTNNSEDDPVTSATLELMYNEGVMYSITVSEISPSTIDGCAEPLNTDSCMITGISGPPPTCCELEFECPPIDGGTFECLDDLPTPDNAIILILNSCETPVITSLDSSNDGEGCVDNPIIITRTYTISHLDSEETCVQTFTIFDSINPMLVGVPPANTVECDDIPTPASVTATDNCDPDPVVSFFEVIVDNPCGQTITRTWTATDSCGNSSVENQILTVIDSEDPTAEPFETELTIECDQPEPTDEPVFSDNCDQDLDIEAISGINNVTECSYDIEKSWTATDNCGNSLTISRVIHVIDTTDPTAEPFETELTIECDQPEPTDEPVFSDNCDQDLDIEAISGINNVTECSYDIEKSWTATDNCGNSLTISRVIHVIDTTDPTAEPFETELTIECDQPEPTDEPVFSDNCDQDLDIEAISGINNVTECSYDIEKSWTATDNCGNSLTISRVIHVVDTTDPIIDGVPNNIEINCNDGIPGVPIVTASDNCDPNPLLIFQEIENFEVCPYTITRIWTATDECGNENIDQYTITIIDNTPPVIDPVPGYVPIECQDFSGLSINAEDDCSEVVITFTDLDYSGGGCYGIFERTWYATDACGNVATTSQVIELMDETDPEFFGVGEDMTIECDELYEVPVVTAVDNCAGELPVTFNEDIVEGDCPHERVITWTWTAEDDCGNIGVATKVLTIQDTTPPMIPVEGGDFDIPCDEYPPLPDVIPTDNCSASEDIIFNMVETNEPFGCSWLITRIWTAEDECGNTNGVIQMFYGYDDVPPVIESVGADVTIECDEPIPAPEIEVSDNCTENPDVQIIEEIVPTDCPSEYTILRYYSATDECLNPSMDVQIITIVDTTPPELSDYPNGFTIACDEDVPAPPTIMATDNCDVEVDVEFEEEYIGEQAPEGSLTFCEALDPGNDDPEWSLVLFDMPTGTEYYTTVEAYWATFPDEGEGQTAHLYGSVVSSSNPEAGWDFDVWFYNGEDFEDWNNEPWPNSYKDDQELAGLNYLDWWYYLVNADAATMSGWGDLEGSEVTLSHAPPNLYFAFQEGVAANNTTDCYGVGGWVYFDGVVVDSFNDIEAEVSGGGDFSFCLDCCPDYEIIRTWTAEDCAGNVTTHSQTIQVNVGDLEPEASPAITACDADFDNSGDVNIIDMLMLSSEFGCTSGCQCDLDNNGHINIIDMIMFSSLYGGECIQP